MAPPVVAWCQTAENPQKPSSYVVKKGDCLWNISKRVWGDPQKWPLLFAANEGKIRNPNLIYPGQKFTIPTSLTAEELHKAVQLAEERSASPAVAVKNMEGTALQTGKKQEVSPASHEPATASSQSKLSPDNAPSTNPPATSAVNPSNPAAGTAETTGGSSKIWILIAALLALGGGIFIWFRKRSGGVLAQQPRPLSSFPQAAEPPVSKPVTTPPAAPTTPSPAQPAGMAPPPQQGANAQPTDRTGGFTGTITSISMSQPPVPSKAEPATPSSSMPSTAPAPSTPPAQKPEDQPPATASNPPSGNP